MTCRPANSAIKNRQKQVALRAQAHKRIEEANGWVKEVGGMAQTKHRGLPRVGWMFTLKAAAYNLVRLPKLLPTG